MGFKSKELTRSAVCRLPAEERLFQVLAPETKILFVSGKGGVGKSVVAAALAHHQARSGRRVLLAELGPRSYFANFFGVDVQYHPQPSERGFDICRWDANECLHEYVLYYFRLESIYKMIFDNSVARTFLNVAPATSELATLGKITSGVRKIGPALDYDLIVVDAFATGHFQSLIRGPIGILKSMGVGPIAKESRSMLDVLQNPKLTEFVVVSLAEELPVVETRQLVQMLKSELHRTPEIVLNRLMPEFQTSETNDNAFTQFCNDRLEATKSAHHELGSLTQVYDVPLITKNSAWEIVEGVCEHLESQL